MQNTLLFKVKPKEALNRFLYQDIERKPFSAPFQKMSGDVNLTEEKFDIIYPVRKTFLNKRLSEKVELKDYPYKNIYTPFENNKVEFSTFLTTPHILSCSAITFIEIDQRKKIPFRLSTCGGVRVWVNEELQVKFDPFTRNESSSQEIFLSFEKGVNKITIYFDDLAERDINYFFELINLSNEILYGQLPLSISVDKYRRAEKMLSSIYFQKDFYSEGKIEFTVPELNVESKELIVKINPKLFGSDEDAQDGNISDFRIKDICIELTKNQKKYTLGNVPSFQTAGITTCQLNLEVENGFFISRKIVISVFNQEKFNSVCVGEEISERKNEALAYYSELDLDDINVALAKIISGKFDVKKDYNKLKKSFELIASKGDCADFVLTPLIATYIGFENEFSEELSNEIEELVLGFRYWIDEPGNDVMWYFSENHALLFHVTQYLAGYRYKNKKFKVSGRLGEEQYEIGKKRLEDWFKVFFKYGLSEWNSTTYLPIDLIGFFSLYLAAPDNEIKQKAKEGLDFIFEIAAINHHGKTMSSTYGRVYEHNLKAMEQGEMSSILQIAWKKGYFNNALRPSFLFSLTDYEPDHKLDRYLVLKDDEYLKAEYKQGVNEAYTYLYKTKEYSLASVISYKPYQEGLQQHTINISLGNNTTLLWLNHPGEEQFSGENRPSFWAGNATLPNIMQYNNICLLHYRLKESSLPYVHLYLPFWDLDEVEIHGKWLFIRKNTSYLGIYFSEGYEITEEGATSHREVRSYGKEHFIIVKCSSRFEIGSFDYFKEQQSFSDVCQSDDSFKYRVNNEELLFKEGKLIINSHEIDYQSSYNRSVEVGKLVPKW